MFSGGGVCCIVLSALFAIDLPNALYVISKVSFCCLSPIGVCQCLQDVVSFADSVGHLYAVVC